MGEDRIKQSCTNDRRTIVRHCALLSRSCNVNGRCSRSITKTRSRGRFDSDPRPRHSIRPVSMIDRLRCATAPLARTVEVMAPLAEAFEYRPCARQVIFFTDCVRRGNRSLFVVICDERGANVFSVKRARPACAASHICANPATADVLRTLASILHANAVRNSSAASRSSHDHSPLRSFILLQVH